MKDRIKQLMDSQGMTQQGFAQMLGINPASLSQVLSGRSNPTLNHVEAIKKSFPNISYKWLLDGSGTMYETDGGQQPDLFSLPPVAPTPTPQRVQSAEGRMQSADKVQSAECRVQSSEGRVQSNVRVQGVERNIKEIVIYYDNNTFETFVPKS